MTRLHLRPSVVLGDQARGCAHGRGSCATSHLEKPDNRLAHGRQCARLYLLRSFRGHPHRRGRAGNAPLNRAAAARFHVCALLRLLARGTHCTLVRARICAWLSTSCPDPPGRPGLTAPSAPGCCSFLRCCTPHLRIPRSVWWRSPAPARARRSLQSSASPLVAGYSGPMRPASCR